MKKIRELTYEQAAEVLGFSDRQSRRLIKKHGIKPIRYGYRTVRVPAQKIAELKIQLTIQ